MPSRDWESLDRQVAARLEALVTEAERRVLTEYSIALKEIREQMAMMYERAADTDGVLTLAQMTKYNRLNSLDKELSRIMDQHYQIVLGEMRRLPPATYNETFFRYAWAFDQHTSVNLTWGNVPQEAIEAASSNPLDLIAHDQLSNLERNRIRRALSQGLLQGKSYPQMMRHVRKAMNSNAYEAMRIVRTEGQRTMSEASEEIYGRAKKNGVQGTEVWDATLDSVTRPSHQTLDGKPRPEDGLWKVIHEGELVRTTGPVLSGVPSFDINCRCRRRFQVDGFEPTLRRTREQGVIPYTTYENWKKKLSEGGIYRPADFS